MRYDIIVIGGGPAGLSAAIQARTRNKSVLVVSARREDIPLWKAERVDNYLGLPGVSGRELLERMDAHAAALGVERKYGRALNAMPGEDGFFVAVGSDVEEAGALILAVGVAHGAKYPGEAEHLGRGVSYCATCDGMFYRDRDVVVAGSSAEAPEEANYLQELGCRVTYVSGKRPGQLRPEIPFVPARKLEILGEGSVTAVRADGQELPCDCAFLLRPSVAPAELLPGLALTGNAIAVDRDGQTNLPGVFAAGDCTGQPLQISKAVGEGLVAGHRAAEYLDRMRTPGAGPAADQ